MQEGISYIAAAELPAVIVNVQRGGPGLGNIAPGQADYFQAVKGGGHGDYKLLVLAPWSITECFYHAALAFELADKYRNPVMVLTDAIIGQMIEQIEVPDKLDWSIPPKPWATTGRKSRQKNVVNSLWIVPEAMEKVNLRMQAKYKRMIEEEVRYTESNTNDAELIIIAYGAMARICKTAVDIARSEGLSVGLFRPITLFPFPTVQIDGLAESGKRFLVVEMSYGQMVEDVRLAVNGKAEVEFFGRSGGVVPTPNEVLDQIRQAFGKSPGVSHYCRTEVAR